MIVSSIWKYHGSDYCLTKKALEERRADFKWLRRYSISKADKGFPQKPLKSSSIARKDDKKNHKGRRRSSLKNLLADSELDTL